MAENTPLSLLYRDRDVAAYEVVGAAFVACSFLNLGEVPKALKTLMFQLEKFTEAANAVDQFHREQVHKQIQSHKESTDGNRTSQSAA